MTIIRTHRCCSVESDGRYAAPYCCGDADYLVRWVCNGCGVFEGDRPKAKRWSEDATANEHRCGDCVTTNSRQRPTLSRSRRVVPTKPREVGGLFG